MDQRLYEAARTGNTNSLDALIGKDPLILERSSLDNIPETCLHIAVLAGRFDFVKKILFLKSEWAERPNRDGFGPIHMASANGYADIVNVLLICNKKLSRQESADGRTALHFATITGRVDVLEALIRSCPECMADLTYLDESAFHIALKNNQIVAFEMLLRMLREINNGEIMSLVNAMDHDGNTILHIAVAMKQIRAVKLLLSQGSGSNVFKVEVNSNNKSGYTALDMLFHSIRTVDDPRDHEIQKMLQQAGALRNEDTIVAADHQVEENNSTSPLRNEDTIVALTSGTVAADHQVEENNSTSPHRLRENNLTDNMLQMAWKFIVKEVSSLFMWNIWSTLTQEIEDSTPDVQNALMVVAVLIATITYQSVLSPPGGYRQFNAEDDPDPVHSIGLAIIASDQLMFGFIIFFSSVGFFLSVVMILMLTNKFPLKILLRLAVLAVSADFICSILYIAPIAFSVISVLTMAMFGLVGIHILYFMTWMLRRYCRACGQRDQTSELETS